MKIRIFKSKKALNSVISNMIILCAVIAVGFTALAWTQYEASAYQRNTAPIINNDINKLQEKLNLEGSTYNSGTLNVFVLNSGSVNITIQNVKLGYPATQVDFKLYTVDNPVAQVESNMLNATSGAYYGMREGNLQIAIPLNTGQSYPIQVITTRGSEFAYTIVG